MQLALICNGMRGRSAGRFDIGFREISSYEQHVQYVIFSPISRYSFSGAGSGYARTCVGPVHGRFARPERARRNGNRRRALNYRRLSESCVVTGAKGNRHSRHVERHIRKRRVLRVRQLLRVRGQRRDNAGHLAADHRLRRCHAVREVVSHPTPSAVEAGNDKAELATVRNAMSQARSGHCSRARRWTNVEGASDTAQCVFAYATHRQSSNPQTHFRLSCPPKPESCMRNDISRIFVSDGSAQVA